MNRLYFIRHGESKANVDGVWGANTRLTEEGIRQAKRAAQHAKEKGLSFNLIISSPMIRAQETAKEIALAVGYPVESIVLDDSIKERYFGELEDSKVADDINMIHGKDETYVEKYKDVESMEALQVRANNVLARLKARPEENILVVSHSSFGRALRRSADAHQYTTSETAFSHLPNAEIFELEI